MDARIEIDAPRCVGIVGMGLIGGSFAKAYADAGVRVLGANRTAKVLEAAKAEGAIDDVLTADNVGECDLVVIALYPQSTVAWLEEMAPFIAENTLVIDCGGVKRSICPTCFDLAESHGFTFVGGHPMAGTQYSGFRHARVDLFAGAPMVLVPPEIYDPEVINRAKAALDPVGFGMYSVTTPEKHDQLIAFTSQLAHVVSSAYIKSPRAQRHRGFSAGSYKDLTRVAELNADMWTELFLDNADNLIAELDCIIGELDNYRSALREGDEALLNRLLAEGSIAKKKADGRFSDAPKGK